MMRKIREKLCKLCQSKYLTREKYRKFCSIRCYSKSLELKINKKCLECGSEFKCLPWQLRKGEGKYCSSKCSIKSRTTRQLVNCVWCNKRFNLNQYRIRNNKRNFCSKSCYWNWRKGKRLNRETEWGNLIELRGFRYSMSYKKGRRFEYKVKDFFEDLDYFVGRSAGSKFPDMIVIKKGIVRLIECKMGGRLSREERERCHQMLDKHGIAIEVIYPKRDFKDKRKINLMVYKFNDGYAKSVNLGNTIPELEKEED